MVQAKFDHWEMVLDANVSKIKSLDLFHIFLVSLTKSSKKLKMGLVQVSPVSNQDEFKWMYDMPYKSKHGVILVSVFFFSKFIFCLYSAI